MYLKEIELDQFRSYEKQKVNFHEKVNIITGENAQGKTNLLESIYIMCLSKSFRTNKDSEMIRFGEKYSCIRSIISKKDREYEIEIILKNNEKTIRLDRQKILKKSDVFSRVCIVVFSPEDLKIVKDEPEKRRRFIDRELCQINMLYYKNLSRYKKILIQRNNILKHESINTNVLAAWDSEMILYGSKIIQERKSFIEKLNKISRKIHAEITSGKEELTIEYQTNIAIKENLEEQKKEFELQVELNQKTDIEKRATTKGPHKDDLKININDIDIRHFGSQGQQRTAALSLKLAEIKLIEEEIADYPVLLLDDVLSELDQSRQRFLINALDNVQLFLTTTELSNYLIESLPDHKIFNIKAHTNEKGLENSSVNVVHF